MIIETVFNMIFGALDFLFAMLPNIEWNVQNSFFTAFYDILAVACYLLPMKTVVMILYIVISVGIFRVFVALIKTLMTLIPFV